MSIAVTPVVRSLVVAATSSKAVKESAADVPAETEVSPAEASSTEASPARRIAWAVVLLLGWGLSYSIGWSKGWTAGALDADARFEALNQCMMNLPQAQALTDAPGNSSRTTESLETATAAEQGPGADGRL